MKEALEAAIKSAAGKASESKTGTEAMQFTQAALNAANALIALSNIGK